MAVLNARPEGTIISTVKALAQEAPMVMPSEELYISTRFTEMRFFPHTVISLLVPLLKMSLLHILHAGQDASILHVEFAINLTSYTSIKLMERPCHFHESSCPSSPLS